MVCEADRICPEEMAESRHIGLERVEGRCRRVVAPHDFDEMISDEVKEELAEVAEMLTSGELETGYMPGG